MTRTFLNDENGFIISAELVLVITLTFCAAAVGWAAARDALVNELNDVSHAIGAVSQSYSVTGFKKEKDRGKPHAQCSGFGYNDDADECDCKIIEYVDVCGKNDPSTGDGCRTRLRQSRQRTAASDGGRRAVYLRDSSRSGRYKQRVRANSA